jgi:hypothetical protein
MRIAQIERELRARPEVVVRIQRLLPLRLREPRRAARGNLLVVRSQAARRRPNLR